MSLISLDFAVCELRKALIYNGMWRAGKTPKKIYGWIPYRALSAFNSCDATMSLQKHSKFANIASMNWTVTYYNERIKRDVFALPVGILADYLRLLDLMQEFGADLRMPHSRAMGDGLFELRPKGREGIGRVFYCTHVGQCIVVLHSFVKKTQETPQNELRTARARLKEVRNG